MSKVSQCPVCAVNFKRKYCPPLTLMPCGHVVCSPCWGVHTGKYRVVRSCPVCRARVQSEAVDGALLDIIEATHSNPELRRQVNGLRSEPSQSAACAVEELYSGCRRRTQFEILTDRCEAAWYVLDNSGSMDVLDGKVFVAREDGSYAQRNYVSRYAELVSKTEAIALYNIQRGLKAAYFLLNPKDGEWIENSDFVIINPDDKCRNAKLHLLMSHILSPANIRGSTPLHLATSYFMGHLREFMRSDVSQTTPICYNILTDGEPDSKEKFERVLKRLVSQYHVFLCVNLCTDEESVVNYYNDLDRKLGSELSGMDVIDDIEAEQREIAKAGNCFFVYTHEFHVCRMAGCYSIAADLLDEQLLPTHFLAVFCKELVVSAKYRDGKHGSIDKSTEVVPHWSECTAFTDYITLNNPTVFNPATKTFDPLINVSKLRRAIRMLEIQCMAKKLISNDKKKVSCAVVVALAVALWWIVFS